jgi:uncharacterized protein
MPLCFFAADLHGRRGRYEALAACARRERPAAIFLGGDLLPHRATDGQDFIEHFLRPLFLSVHADTDVTTFLILGNDDERSAEPFVEQCARDGAWSYVHNQHVRWAGFDVYGYACVPPTPFLLKDWERYDVSRHLDPGCVSPEEGMRTVAVESHEVRTATIATDLEKLTRDEDLSSAIVLFHTPPYRTVLDRAALDGRMVEYAPLDVHIGSIAVRRFILARQPQVTLHGHVHESSRLTGEWQGRLGRTVLLGAAHDGPELALIRFDPDSPQDASRELIAHPPGIVS